MAGQANIRLGWNCTKRAAARPVAERDWWWPRTAAAVIAMALWPATSLGADFRIRKVTLQGDTLYLYHEHIADVATGDVKVKVGGHACKALSSDVLKPMRGGDLLTTLVVLDRGGSDKTGMGQYTQQVRDAVKKVAGDLLAQGSGDTIAVIDSPGRNQPPGQLAPTKENAAVQAFLDGLPAPAGSGADVYGTANVGLGLLDKAASRLRAVIVISDGIDPAAEREANVVDNHATLVAEANRRGVPIAAVHVDRAGEAGRSRELNERGQQGRARMNELANKTNGEFRTVGVGSEFQAKLASTLRELAGQYADVDRTACAMCGEYQWATNHLVSMTVEKNAKAVATSRGEPLVLLSIPQVAFGSCDTGQASTATATVAEGGTCRQDGDCGDCGSCSKATCAAKTCAADTDCAATCKCGDGKCAKRKTAKDYLPIFAVVAAALGVGLFLWASARRRKREAAVAESARQETEKRQAKQQAEMQGRFEQERQAREQLERNAHQAEARRQAEMAGLQDKLNPILLRVATAPGSTATCDVPVRAGSFVIGARSPADILLDAPTVSGAHARLDVEPNGRASLTDLGSSNGTYLNQYKLSANQTVEVRPGDQIGISTRIVLTIATAS